MEQILPQAQVATAPALPRQLAGAGSVRAQDIGVLPHSHGIVAVWQAALNAFGAQSLQIMVIALAGFAGARILLEITRSLVMRDLCTQPLWGLCGPDESPDLFAVVQVIVNVFTQGLIAFTVLRVQSQTARLGLTRWLALLMGWLVYAALLTVAQKMTPASVQSVWRQIDRPAQARNTPPGVAELDSVSRTLLTSTLQALVSDPGVSLAGAFVASDSSTRPLPPSPVCYDEHVVGPQINLDRLYAYIATHCVNSTSPSSSFDGLLMASAAALFLGTETLLRFRIVAAFALDESDGQGGLWRPIIAGVQLAWRHIGTVTWHIWVLRLATVVFQMLFCVLPALMVQRYIEPEVKAYLPSGATLAPVLLVATATGTAVVNAIVAAFSTVYDAQLLVDLLD